MTERRTHVETRTRDLLVDEALIHLCPARGRTVSARLLDDLGVGGSKRIRRVGRRADMGRTWKAFCRSWIRLGRLTSVSSMLGGLV